MDALLLMAKAPRAGLAKTRLARDAGLAPERAARLAAAFLGDTLDALRAVRGATRFLFFAPEDAEAELRALDPAARFFPQPAGDLGARLAHAFDVVFAAGARRAVALGADAPHLTADVYADALAALDEAELVLGPSEDGGYYLIGLRARRPALFEQLEWSTPRVRAETLARARAAGLSVRELEQQFDVDEPADLERLRALLALAGPGRCPRTALALAELD